MPPRRHTKAFETSPDLEWEFYIADRLGRTVGEMRESMSADEFTRWVVFHQRKAQRHELAVRRSGG